MKRECRPKHCKQEVVCHTGYPDKALVSIVTPSCVASQPVRNEILTGQEVMFTTLPEHAITSLIRHIQCSNSKSWPSIL